jgi:diadenosine hexaphosphate hydrolase (ATP-forming)
MREISAGGVVYRVVDGRIEIQLIRDRFGKMTLAKGKLEPGETAEQAALREIEEETGIAGEIVAPLLTVQYHYEKPDTGRIDKTVHYYLVRALEGELRAQIGEIGGVSWLDPMEAWDRQRAEGYANNDEVLRLALKKLGVLH